MITRFQFLEQPPCREIPQREGALQKRDGKIARRKALFISLPDERFRDGRLLLFLFGRLHILDMMFAMVGESFQLRRDRLDAPFKLFQHFGFQSGRDVDKFAEFRHVQRSHNGLLFLDKYANAYISCRVIDKVDLETHVMFICDVTECVRLSDQETMTYTYYQKNVKPKPDTAKKGYVINASPPSKILFSSSISVLLLVTNMMGRSEKARILEHSANPSSPGSRMSSSTRWGEKNFTCPITSEKSSTAAAR